MAVIRLVKEKKSIDLADLKTVYPEAVERTLNRDLQALFKKKILKAWGEKKGRGYQCQNINQLKKKGLLRRCGPDKGGHWELLH